MEPPGKPSGVLESARRRYKSKNDGFSESQSEAVHRADLPLVL